MPRDYSKVKCSNCDQSMLSLFFSSSELTMSEWVIRRYAAPHRHVLMMQRPATEDLEMLAMPLAEAVGAMILEIIRRLLRWLSHSHLQDGNLLIQMPGRDRGGPKDLAL